jgi:hypothetical protein
VQNARGECAAEVNHARWLARLRDKNRTWNAAHPEQRLVARCETCDMGYLTVNRDDAACLVCGGRIVKVVKVTL